jgi:hypothetical protein
VTDLRQEPPIAVSIARLRKIWGVAGYETSDWVPFGELGVRLTLMTRNERGTVIVSEAMFPVEIDPQERDWIHASLSWISRIPGYEELALLHESVFGPTRTSYQVFAAADRHVNFHPNALHLWGLASGERALPDFGRYGMV